MPLDPTHIPANPCLIEILQSLKGWVIAGFLFHLTTLYLTGKEGRQGDQQENQVREAVFFWTLPQNVPGMGVHFQPHPSPLQEARPPCPQRKGVACIQEAGPVGIGQRKCPWRQCSCLDRGNGKSLKRYRGCWCIFSLQPCLAPVSCIDVVGRVHQRPPFLAWSWQQKVVTIPKFPSSTPSVIRIAVGVASPLIVWQVWVINSTPSLPLHVRGGNAGEKPLWN